MRFDNTDKSFAVKISSLFILLLVGVLVQKNATPFNNANQDIIKLENNKPSIIQTISIKKTNSQQLYNNPLR